MDYQEHQRLELHNVLAFRGKITHEQALKGLGKWFLKMILNGKACLQVVHMLSMLKTEN